MTRPAPPAVPEPVGYRLHHRSGRPGSRWSLVVETLCRVETVARMNGRGEFWVEYVYQKAELKRETLQPTLFD